MIELFNAVHGTNYQETDDFEINTIEGILYMTTKNDVSFLMESTMNLYEHQSTYNPNMPLRGLLYFGQLYHKYIKTRGLNIYSSKLQKIPVPHYVIFYNGTQEEYAIFVARLREYAKEYPNRLDIAITRAIDDCIGAGILKDFLIKHKSEVLEMVLYSFDKELYEKDLKQIAYEEGEQNKLIQQVQKKLNKGQSVEVIAEELEESVRVIQDIITKINNQDRC